MPRFSGRFTDGGDRGDGAALDDGGTGMVPAGQFVASCIDPYLLAPAAVTAVPGRFWYTGVHVC